MCEILVELLSNFIFERYSTAELRTQFVFGLQLKRKANNSGRLRR